MSHIDYTKGVVEVLEKYQHKFVPYSLFERFLEFVVIGFDISHAPIDRPFNQEEAEACGELFSAWVYAMRDALNTKPWYDLLGEVYMNYIAGKMKKQWTGQFFTPMHICDFMAKITSPGESHKESVMDCCCGSGRMLLASHALNLGNYCCAQDMDRTCCLMTVCNFIIHGINGEVIWGDSLDSADYRDGWRTNEALNIVGIPSVRKMEKIESRMSRASLEDLTEKNDTVEVHMIKPQTKAKRKRLSIPQPSLFD